MITVGPSLMPKWYGEIQPMPSSPWTRYSGLIDALKPYAFGTRIRSFAKLASAGRTISGANGSDAATAHGASVPSSGPYGAPRATYPRKRRVTPLTRRTAGPGPLLAVMPQ